MFRYIPNKTALHTQVNGVCVHRCVYASLTPPQSHITLGKQGWFHMACITAPYTQTYAQEHAHSHIHTHILCDLHLSGSDGENRPLVGEKKAQLLRSHGEKTSVPHTCEHTLSWICPPNNPESCKSPLGTSFYCSRTVLVHLKTGRVSWLSHPGWEEAVTGSNVEPLLVLWKLQLHLVVCTASMPVEKLKA